MELCTISGSIGRISTNFKVIFRLDLLVIDRCFFERGINNSFSFINDHRVHRAWGFHFIIAFGRRCNIWRDRHFFVQITIDNYGDRAALGNFEGHFIINASDYLSLNGRNYIIEIRINSSNVCQNALDLLIRTIIAWRISSSNCLHHL